MRVCNKKRSSLIVYVFVLFFHWYIYMHTFLISIVNYGIEIVRSIFEKKTVFTYTRGAAGQIRTSYD